MNDNPHGCVAPHPPSPVGAAQLARSGGLDVFFKP
ncbi:hypothetical protein BURPS406E_G0203 [Burkholderia pseudomallei 406e]|uniref:Uncharacterized protein n=1 Tax=Burkholderia pseudomallei (strain 1710b) TaxID=320372 RepID=Q3JG04_BURP1|nr:hypothetical protein BURPS1710b_A2348 [Burkholderia pseudomallei 1710b]AFR19007.1 hypothetical protein BPC006_II1078 [Burkholderia pseudomallei BPC006]EDO87066.1 hypothetical protein BURPS406E_G0203 [Burkholderia pseudomallei 406e]EDO93164.1 hypothetical protein BURPSPAST_J0416 [Burkholderia pseudomallei Pasteur 52237]EDS82213.1 hypothetical protein BURPSS13_T0181 [Burkholderia pseudomallei S13]EDU10771.1 hypothetical protein BURPS1655_I0343 [Burkholderia pseudomallei 1655]